MVPMDILLGIAFLFQTGIGVQGNFFLIYLYSFLFFTGQRLRPIDVILTPLALANSLVLLSRGFVQTLAAFGMKNILDDMGCKIVFYLQRVSRGLSLSITCLLSGFQAIIISPPKPRWMKMKARVPRSITPSILLCWGFHILQNIPVLMKLKSSWASGNNSETKEYLYCSTNVTTAISSLLHAFVFSFPDAVCMTLIIITTAYKVYLLYKHHKRVQQVHTENFSCRVFPEIRATQTILLLVSTFVTSYLLNSTLTGLMHIMTLKPWLLHSSAFLVSFFPMVSPFLLISSDPQILRYYNALHGIKNPHTECLQ